MGKIQIKLSINSQCKKCWCKLQLTKVKAGNAMVNQCHMVSLVIKKAVTSDLNDLVENRSTRKNLPIRKCMQSKLELISQI